MALPDYPSLKRDISNYLLLIMKSARDQQMGPFNQSRRVHIHEGDSSDYSTADYEIRELELQRVGIEDTLNYSDFAQMTDADVRQTMVRYGTEFAAKLYQLFLSNINTTLEAAGNIVEVKGQALNAPMLLDIFEKIEMSFGDDGRPNVDILCNPAQRAAIDTIMNEDEEFKVGFAALIEAKKEAWLARQSNRKLVD